MATEVAESKVPALTQESVARIRAKPALVTVGSREVSPCGWRDDMAIDYIRRNGRDRYITVGELARVFYGQNVPVSKERVRRRLPGITYKLVAQHAEVLIPEIEGSYRRVSAVKIFDPSIPVDIQAAKEKIRKMAQRKKITAEQFDLLCAVIGDYEAMDNAGAVSECKEQNLSN